MRVGFAILSLFLSVPAFAQDDSLVSIGDPGYLGNATPGRITYLKYPTIGCPAIVKAGGIGTAYVRVDDGGAGPTFEVSITPTGDAGATYALPVTGLVFDSTTACYKVSYQIPANVPDDTYDVQVSIANLAVTDKQFNALRVVKQETTTYTFIVISDSHFNTPTGFWSPGNYNTGNYNAWTIMGQMKKEIRALNPTFVILSGDLMFGLDYDYEYEGVWNTFKDLGVPVFMVPGNHDGMSCIEERSFLGITSPVRDGLDYWRRYFGPLFYSFEFGGVHIQAVNSMDGSAERRDGFLIVIENYGGDLDADQMDWIAADLAGAAGQTVIPFLHHNPMGSYRPNGEFGMFDWVLNRIWEWITTGNFDDYSQTWNTQSTGEFLLQQYAALPLVFIGHGHDDVIYQHNNTIYKMTTTASASGDTYWGYTHVKVVNSQVAEYLYLNQDYQSIPTGNLYVEYGDAEATVTSGLSKSYDVTLEFTMPTAPNYAATNGTVVQFAPIDATTSRVWVKAATPVSADIQNPESVTVTVAPAAAVGGSVENTAPAGSSGGGAACGLLGLEVLLLLGLVRILKR